MQRNGAVKTFILLLIFGIAMGIAETATVVYLREIAALAETKSAAAHAPYLLSVERIREAATIAMLAIVAIVAGKTLTQRVAYFLFPFAVWDIFYYVGLKVFVGWPPSLLTWDVLFYIPTTWRGPMLAPVLVSLTLISLALTLVFKKREDLSVRAVFLVWTLSVSGYLAILFTFLENSVLRGASGQPITYRWATFSIGLVYIIAAQTLCWTRGKPKGD